MILTISEYIEALQSGNGRFRTLEKLRAVPDGAGLPVFTMPGHGLVDFEVTVGDVPHTLRCPLWCNADHSLRLRTMGERDRGLGGRFFAEWKLLEREVVLFDETGSAFEIDILVRPTPQGEPLADFLAKSAVRRDTDILGAAMRSFGELVEWAQNAGRSGIAARRILAAPGGELSLAAFSANDETPLIAEMLRAAAAGESIPNIITADSKREKSINYDLFGDEDIKCVRDGGGWMYVDSRNRTVIDKVWKSASPFREGRAEVETYTGKGLIDRDGKAILDPVYEEVTWDDYWGLMSVMAEGCWSLRDRNGVLLTQEPYDWLGECIEGMILVEKDGKNGFLDAEGHLVIPCIYEEASSFAEGLATVTLDGQSFFVDSKGVRQ